MKEQIRALKTVITNTLKKYEEQLDSIASGAFDVNLLDDDRALDEVASSTESEEQITVRE